MNHFSSIFQYRKAGLLLLITIWGVIQTAAYFYFDLKIPEDSVIYIRNAESLLHGNLPEGRELLYLAYSSLIAIPLLFELDPIYTLFFHLVAAVVAIICMYKLTLQLSGNNQTAFLATLFYVLWFKFQQWNLILYTDSLFTSLVIINTYLIFKANRLSQKVLVGLLILFTIFIRPPGIGLLVALGAYMIITVIKSQRIKRSLQIGFTALLSIIALLSVNAALTYFIDSFMESYQMAEIIYPGIPLFVETPESFTIPHKGYSPLIQLPLTYILNPVYMIKISFIKGALFLAHIKPYYSIQHNLFIGAFLYPLYFFAIKGFTLIINHRFKIFMGVFVGFQLLTVCLTSENWDGRFLLPVLPFVFIFGAEGINQRLEKIVKLQ